MQLIKKIEINYFRSLYSAVLDNVGDSNIIFGRNDSGKSNLLRSLNLFFNGNTDVGRNLDFDLDMSDYRKREAREAKGRQFIWIKITFNVPDNYVKALGKEITIKRQWNKDGNITESIFPSLKDDNIKSRLTRFLNDIDFTYIPAIKDLNVYADLIERMYGAAADTLSLKTATTDFVAAIEKQTETLSGQLTKLFGGPANLAPPTEMSRLFRSLDFVHGSDRHSLLRQKGDGVKARHLPELLRFINENEQRKKFYLWGFEEPENSLDLGAASTEANRFSKFSKRTDTQVFITSHSPAFYLADDTGVNNRRYFITRQIKSDDVMLPNNAASPIDKLQDAEKAMANSGLLQLPYMIRHLKNQDTELRRLEEDSQDLRKRLSELDKPTLFVEGKHDVKLFESSLKELGKAGEIAVKPLGGTPQTADALLSALLKQGGLNASAKSFFLFDDDKAGRNSCRKLTGS